MEEDCIQVYSHIPNGGIYLNNESLLYSCIFFYALLPPQLSGTNQAWSEYCYSFLYVDNYSTVICQHKRD